MKLNVNIRKGEKSKQLRIDGFVPAIVYGKHLTSPIAITCKKNEFIKKYKESGYSTPITLEGTGVEEMVLIQDIQLDPVSDIVLHVDFLAVRKDQKVTTEVPVKIVGEAPVEKLGEGKVQLVKGFVKVEAFPQDLPHDIKVDISHIEKSNETIFVKDLKVSENVQILDDAEQPIITVVSLLEETEEAKTDVAAATTPVAPAKK